MDEAALRRLIQNTVLSALARRGEYYLPVAVSARHVHLSRRDFQVLFGKGASMTALRDLSQPGQFAAAETVDVSGPRGTIKKVRVLGPERGESQVEVSLSDGFTLGIAPPVRMSGDVAGTPGCTLTGPSGKVELSFGLIAAARHVHLSEEQAAAYGLKDGGVVSLRVPAPREGIIGGVAVRVGKRFDLEVHLDTDEANGNWILCGTILPAVMRGVAGQEGDWPRHAEGGNENQRFSFRGEASPLILDLVTERDVNAAVARGERTVYCAARGLVSPAAADRAAGKGVVIERR